MDYSNYTCEQLIGRIAEIEMLSKKLLPEKVYEKKQGKIYLIKENNCKYIDKLTGGKNKNSFEIKVKEIIKSNWKKHAFIALDIDKFQLVNDFFGYAQGDLLLKHIANVLSHHTCHDETFARITGDKFHIILEFMAKDELKIRLDKIIEDISSFKFTPNSHFNIVVCIGIFIINNTDNRIDIMSDKASLAANIIKGNYTSSHSFYTNDMRNQMILDTEIESEMFESLENGDFKVYMQPKYNLNTGEIAGAEALIRWNHPRKGIIQPDNFIPVFEKNGFLKKIDMYVLEEICKKQKEWLAQGRRPFIVSLNQSRLHLSNPIYVDTLKSIIEKYDINPRIIELELTESAFFCDIDLILNIGKRLHNIGFKLSIDDFGSKYSTLNILKDGFFIDTLKIDREFLKENANTIRGKKIIKSIIMLSKDLGIETVAEGVETKEQVEFLRNNGCDLAQGYYYAKPMPMADFDVLLEKENKA